MTLTHQTAAELASMIRQRRTRAQEVVEAHLDRIRGAAELNAIVTLDAEGAVQRAREIDAALDRGRELGPLAGVPFTLKDMHATAGMRTTAGLPPLADHVPAEDGVAAERLQAAGGILLGKTNMAMNVESDGDLFGRPKNPYDLERTTGGSSGGAASAIAARLIPLDIGTDMSGSIRMPAHYCGIFGLKPTLHRIPSFGMVVTPDPTTPRFDRWLGVSGPMARSIEDLHLGLRILAGPHPRDPSSPPVPVAMPEVRAPRDLRIAVSRSIEGIPNAAEQADALASFAEQVRAQGATVDFVEMPIPFERLLAGFRRLIGISMQLFTHAAAPPPGAEKLAPTGLSAREVFEALDERDRITAEFEAFVGKYDAWLTPVTPGPAFRHRPRGEPIEIDGQKIPSQVIDHPCIAATYTGCPALVIPVATSSSGLPIGAQLHAPRWKDEALLDVGAAVASVTGPLAPPPERWTSAPT